MSFGPALLLPAILSLAAGAAPLGPAPTVTMDSRRVLLELALLSDAQDEPLLVALQSSGGGWVSEGLARIRPEARIELVRIRDDNPQAEQVAVAMGRSGAHCAVSLLPAPRGGWDLRHWGSCSDGSGLVSGPTSSTGTLVVESFEGVDRDPEALAQQLHLVLFDDDDGGWGVFEGSGYPMSTLRFALQVGDHAAVQQLEAERRSGTLATVGLGVAGGLAAVTGLGLVAAGFGDADSALRYEQQVAAEQRAWTGVVLCTGGVLLSASIPRLRRSLVERSQRPDRYYQRAHAQELSQRYNRDVDLKLGVAEAPAAADEQVEDEP
jgi:hypothetical protein